MRESEARYDPIHWRVGQSPKVKRVSLPLQEASMHCER